MRRVVLVALLLACPAFADDRDKMTVGVQKDGSILTPTNQLLTPAGTQVLFPGRPVDLVLTDDGKTLVAKNMKGLEFIDVATGKVTQTLAQPAAAKDEKAFGFSAVGLISVGDRLFVSDSQSAVRVAKKGDGGKWAWEPAAFKLPAPAVKGAAYPTGMATDGDAVWVCSNRANDLLRLDAKTGKDLWHIQTNASAALGDGHSWRSSPMTYLAGGKQYIAFAAGPNILSFGLP